jgi:hypothetical protein
MPNYTRRDRLRIGSVGAAAFTNADRTNAVVTWNPGTERQVRILVAWQNGAAYAPGRFAGDA